MILSLFLFSFNILGVSCPQESKCPARLQKQSLTEDSLPESSLKIVEAVQKDKEFQSILAEFSQKRDAVLESKEFQNFVTTLQAQMPLQMSAHQKPGELYLFVSFSLGEKALLNLAQEAKLYGATLVLRGFKDNSYAKTVQALQNIIIKTGQGFIIDPELFSLFAVTAVPTTILSHPFQFNALERTQTPFHDRIQGYVSLQYALETFAREGDLVREAQALLTENYRLQGGRK